MNMRGERAGAKTGWRCLTRDGQPNAAQDHVSGSRGGSRGRRNVAPNERPDYAPIASSLAVRVGNSVSIIWGIEIGDGCLRSA
jgi:hypothetical protein